ncbi:hypothetical protein SLE2022_372210 [Rubroshorea leprosula]
MGFIQRLFGIKKSTNNLRPEKDRRRWSFIRSSNTTQSKSNKSSVPVTGDDTLDANKHAIAVAAATAAAAEAALAAVHAAAEVVRLTTGGGGGGGGGCRVGSHRHLAQEMAAVKIQSAFRGYLAKRALRALKALVKLQALVRGHIVRKQTADMLRRMQTLVRLQARARSSRAYMTESFNSRSKLNQSRSSVPASPVKCKSQLCTHSTKFDGPSILKRCSNSNLRDTIDLEKARMGPNWLDRWMEENSQYKHGNALVQHDHGDDGKSDKILEVDTWKPHLTFQQSNRNFKTSQHGLSSDYNNYSFMTFDSPRKFPTKASSPVPSVSSGDVLSPRSMKYPGEKDEAVLLTADNSPRVLSASSRHGNSARRSPCTSTRSEGSWGYFGGYSGHQNYMANTESSRAKYRSQSAPRQRLEFVNHGSMRRSEQDPWDGRTTTDSERDFSLPADYRHQAYHPVSSFMYRLGTANQG